MVDDVPDDQPGANRRGINLGGNYKSFAAAILGVSAIPTAQAAKCYALAFSSGDESAAYQAGVLKGLTESYDAADVNYTAISGISGGAINAAILANFEAG